MHCKVISLQQSYVAANLAYIMLKYLYVIQLQWLEDEFLPYLEQWENSVKKRRGFSDKEKMLMLITKETRAGIKVTGEYNIYRYIPLQ